MAIPPHADHLTELLNQVKAPRRPPLRHSKTDACAKRLLPTQSGTERQRYPVIFSDRRCPDLPARCAYITEKSMRLRKGSFHGQTVVNRNIVVQRRDGRV